MNREFFKCKKRLIEIEEGVLNKWIGKNNKNSRKKYEVKNIKKNDKNGIDDFVIYELECCKKTDVLIYDLDSVIENRLSKWKQPSPRYTKGVLAKYAKLAQSASRGAITE